MGLSRENVIIVSLATLILFAFGGLWFLPTLQEHRRLLTALPTARQRLAGLRQAVPLLAELRRQTARLPESPETADEVLLPLTESTALLDRLERLAIDEGLTVRDINVETTASEERVVAHLNVTIDCLGAAAAGRRFLDRLVAVPQIAAIEAIRFAAGRHGTAMTFQLRIDLAPRP